MERLYEKFRNQLKYISFGFTRSIMTRINWEARLICIKGARGVGKTTLILQYIKKNFPGDETVLYASLDDLWFSKNSLYEMADNFVKQGGKRLFLDEVHKYKNWSQEIKNIYDSNPGLKIVFTGSSLLELKNAAGDLSRRADNYRMQGLSFREFINYEINSDLPTCSIENIGAKHPELSGMVKEITNPIGLFRKYLRTGYYPFYKEAGDLYHDRIMEVISYIIDTELPLLRKVDISNCYKIKKILLVLAESSPMVPKIKELARAAHLDANTVINYLNYLAEADIIKNYYEDLKGISRLKKPENIYIENTNISHALPAFKPDSFRLNSTFLANQLSYDNKISVSGIGKLITDNGITVTVSAENENNSVKSKTLLINDLIAVDNIEYGHGNRIPLWIFGFLY